MTNTKLNFQPIFASTFESLTNDEGFLLNKKGLACLEICDKAIAILRTSKDKPSDNSIIKKEFGFELPEPLSFSKGNDMLCLWISPDEFWIIHSDFQRDELWQKQENLQNGITLVENSAAYGTLEFSGSKVNLLLSRWMVYDLDEKLASGKAVSTTFGKAQVLIYCEKEGELTMLVRHSFSHYLASLLIDSAKRL